MRIAWLALLCSLAAASAIGATRYDPRLHFRTISTRRFDVHFHQGEELIARRLAIIAEDVASTLDASLGPASGRVQVVVVNQSDSPNGWATPVPYNLIEIAAAGPRGGAMIGNTDDWLRLVFTHEYTHVVHLGRSQGWIGGFRRLLGRNVALFPNLALPLWSVEGLATFEESARTGYGRTNGGDFRQLVTTAAGSSRFEPLDRASGGLDDWPSGNAQYLYGGLFHRYLAETYGEASLRQLTDATARRLPYLGTPAFKRVYGKSLGDLWSAFEADERRSVSGDSATARRLTHHGFNVSAPRFAAGGGIYYSIANPDGFPTLMELGDDAHPHQVTNRYLGNQITVAGSLVVFDELSVVENVALQSDLYAFDTRSGQRTRLTEDSRAADPDVARDGARVVFTRQRDDRRELVVAKFTAAPAPGIGQIQVLASTADVEYASPRWAPDGHSVAVERHPRGSLSQIVVVDVETRAERAVTGGGARSVEPAWMPDGRLLYASTRDGGGFQLFASDPASHTTVRLEGTGATVKSPDVSADGRTLVFVGYTPDGYDLFTMPLASAEWTPISADRAQAVSVSPEPAGTPGGVELSARTYTPVRTLAPRYWTPIVLSDGGETMFGAATSGADALGRHGYAADVRWATSRRRPDWQVAYTYDRWWPLLFVNTSDDTDPYQSGESQSREVNAGAVFPWSHVRWAQSVLGAVHAATDTLDCPDCERPLNLRAERRSLRSGYSFSSARSYGFSISREEGWSFTATDEWIAPWLGSDGDAGSVVADLRSYHRAGWRHSVIAARAALATSWGDDNVRRSFTNGGPGPRPVGFDFDSDAIGLLRGFDDDVRGRHAAVVNADYRFPIRRVERGVGTLPFFLRTIHGALFVDAGHAWDETFRLDEARVSAGAELSADTVLGYSLPLTLTGGVAVRRDGLDRTGGVTVFWRIGRAF